MSTTTKKPAAKKATTKKATARKTAPKKGANGKTAPAKKGAPKKATAKKAPAKGKATGKAVVDLLKRAGDIDAAKGPTALAADLAKGTLDHKGLVALRDGINEVNAALRENGKAALANDLSMANRMVRRLERAARKGK